MLDILNEATLTLAEAAAALSARLGGRPVAYNKVWSWVRHGLRGGAVRLEAARVGGSLMTSAQAVDRFLARLNGAGAPAAAAVRDPRAGAV